jgi:hypothetical protein
MLGLQVHVTMLGLKFCFLFFKLFSQMSSIFEKQPNFPPSSPALSPSPPGHGSPFFSSPR